ncbi:MAG: aminotransferase class I/II-fold pyridoxal phosphate-dependent enzyme, partial [Caldilinea sp.]
LGMMMAPPIFRERLIAARIAADLGSSPLLQRTLATFLHRGEFRRHLRQTIPIYRERRNAMLRALENFMPAGVTWTRPVGGFCCWLTLPRHPGMGDAPNLILQQGWAVAPGNVFLTDGNGDFHLRLCFGALTPDNIRQGVRLVSEIIRRQLAVEPLAPKMSGEWTPLV